MTRDQIEIEHCYDPLRQRDFSRFAAGTVFVAALFWYLLGW